MAARSKPRPKPKTSSPTTSRRKPRTRRPALPSRAKRSPLASRPSLPSLTLEPHHVDILALALIAVGIFLGGVAYLHWAGGALGDGAVRGIRYVLGALGYAVPAGLVAPFAAYAGDRFRRDRGLLAEYGKRGARFMFNGSSSK